MLLFLRQLLPFLENIISTVGSTEGHLDAAPLCANFKAFAWIASTTDRTSIISSGMSFCRKFEAVLHQATNSDTLPAPRFVVLYITRQASETATPRVSYHSHQTFQRTLRLRAVVNISLLMALTLLEFEPHDTVVLVQSDSDCGRTCTVC